MCGLTSNFVIVVLFYGIVIYNCNGEVNIEDKVEMQSKFASMENQLNNLFQQSMSEVKNTVDGRVLQYRNRGDYRRAGYSEQLGKTFLVEIEAKGNVELLGLAGNLQIIRLRISSPDTSQNDLENTKQSLEDGKYTKQLNDNIAKFKQFVSQKMTQYSENTSKKIKTEFV